MTRIRKLREVLLWGMKPGSGISPVCLGCGRMFTGWAWQSSEVTSHLSPRCLWRAFQGWRADKRRIAVEQSYNEAMESWGNH